MREVILKKALENLVSRLHYASHIIPLLQNETLAISFCLPDEQKMTILINKDERQIEDECTSPSVTIQGELSSLVELIEGKVKLQSLQTRGEIDVHGKFGQILRVESLLYCCSNEVLKIN